MEAPSCTSGTPVSEACSIEIVEHTAPQDASLMQVWKLRLRTLLHRCALRLQQFAQLVQSDPRAVWAIIWFAISTVFAVFANQGNNELINACNHALLDGRCVFKPVNPVDECPTTSCVIGTNSCVLIGAQGEAEEVEHLPWTACTALTDLNFYFSAGSPFLIGIYVWMTANVMDVCLRFLITLCKNVRMPRTFCVHAQGSTTYLERAFGFGSTGWVLYDVAATTTTVVWSITGEAYYAYSAPLLLMILRSPHFLSAIPITLVAIKSLQKCASS